MAKQVLYKGFIIKKDKIATFINRHDWTIYVMGLICLILGAIAQNL